MLTIRVWYAGCVAIAVGACSGGDLTLPSVSGPAALEIISGDEQRAKAGTALDEPLLVRVADANGQPVRGVLVEFRFVGTIPGAALDPSIAETGSDGEAAATARLGTTTGTQSIVASVAGSQTSDLQVTFRAVAVSGNGSDDDDNDEPGDDDPESLGISSGQLPPPGSCRVWFPNRSGGQQPAPESCEVALNDAPAGSWVLYRPANRPGEVKVYVIDSRRAGIVVRVLVYDADDGRFLREEES
jgi:hypothetical protein